MEKTNKIVLNVIIVFLVLVWIEHQLSCYHPTFKVVPTLNLPKQCQPTTQKKKMPMHLHLGVGGGAEDAPPP